MISSAMAGNLVANAALGSSLDGRGGSDILWGADASDILCGGTEHADRLRSYGQQADPLERKRPAFQPGGIGGVRANELGVYA